MPLTSLGSWHQPASPRVAARGHQRPPQSTGRAHGVLERARGNLYPLTHPGLLLLDRHSALAGWVTRPGSSRPPRLPQDSGLLGCDGLGLGAWVEWARPLQAHLPLVPPKIAQLMLRGSINCIWHLVLPIKD